MNSIFSLSAHNAIITGGTRGIGLAVARGFLEAGATVTLCSRKQENVDAALAEQVMDRLIGEFETEYPTFCDASPLRRYFEIAPPADEASVKEVLTAIFAPPTYH